MNNNKVVDLLAYFVRMLNQTYCKTKSMFNRTHHETGKKSFRKYLCNFSFDELNIFLQTKTKWTKIKTTKGIENILCQMRKFLSGVHSKVWFFLLYIIFTAIIQEFGFIFHPLIQAVGQNIVYFLFLTKSKARGDWECGKISIRNLR